MTLPTAAELDIESSTCCCDCVSCDNSIHRESFPVWTTVNSNFYSLLWWRWSPLKNFGGYCIHVLIRIKFIYQWLKTQITNLNRISVYYCLVKLWEGDTGLYSLHSVRDLSFLYAVLLLYSEWPQMSPLYLIN